MITKTTMSEHESPGAREDSEEALHALVVAPDVFTAIPLPESGCLLVGRTAKADVQLEDPMASRNHAKLHVGETLAIEDLGSSNGTRLHDRAVPSGTAVPINLGDAIRIGSTVLIVQRSSWAAGYRRLWSHLHFEARLKGECAQSDTTGRRFALMRLHVSSSVPWTRVFPVLVRNLMPPHVLAVYGPNEYEALILEPNNDVVDRMVEAIRSDANTARDSIRIGVSWYPRDGRSADALLAKANELLRPEPPFPVTAEASSPSSSPALQRVYEEARRAAGANINVLILGETGVGKEVMARTFHQKSPRATKPLVTLNCAGLTDSLIEAELFGHEKGAFTGAIQSSKGLLESAEGGIVFLDEIGEMPLKVQATLLRAIENREIMPVGGRRSRPIDVRFIAATNRDLDAESKKGTFRQDLFFRLNGMSLIIPPLRERISEIPELAREFVLNFCQECDRPAPELSDEVLSLLRQYSWPGNIRELKNIVERAALLCDGPEILLTHLPVEQMKDVKPASPPHEQEPASEPAVLPAPTPPHDLNELQRLRIVEALEKFGGNQSRAAKWLNMPRRTLITKLDFFGIRRPQKDSPA